MGAILIAVAYYCRTHTVLASEAVLQSGLQAKIPMGSTKAEVLAYADKAGWSNPSSSEGRFWRVRAGMDSMPNNTLSWEMGHYSIRQHIIILAEFEFDQSNRLYEISVTKAFTE